MQCTHDLISVATKHVYTTEQMTAVISSVASARFRYSAALVPWTGTQLNKLDQLWIRLHKLAFRLQSAFPQAPFKLPPAAGGCPLIHPRVLQLQALTQHVQQLALWEDDILAQAQLQYKTLCTLFGCHSQEELQQALSEAKSAPNCPIVRLFKLSSEFGLKVSLPTAMTSTSEPDPTLSWFALKVRVRNGAKELGDRGELTKDMKKGLEQWDLVVAGLKHMGYKNPTCMPLSSNHQSGKAGREGPQPKFVRARQTSLSSRFPELVGG